MKGILHTKDENKHNHESTESTKPHDIELAAHTQILKQQKQLNGRNHHIPLNTNTEW
jgi:hypothetical protein